MADKEQYIIKVEGKPIEVTPEVYYAYYRMARQERGQEEKKQRNGVFSYDALDTGETVGLEAMPDSTTPSIEEALLNKELKVCLHRAIESLPRAERELIQAIYFDGLTEREYAKHIGMSQSGVSHRLRKTLSKIRILMSIIGSFWFFVFKNYVKLDK